MIPAIAILAVKEALKFLDEFQHHFSREETQNMKNGFLKFLHMKAGQRKDEYYNGVIKQYLNKIALTAINSAEKRLFSCLLDFV